MSQGKVAGDTHRKGTVMYKVMWAGVSADEATWEPKSYLAAELVEAYEQQLGGQSPEPASPAAEKRSRAEASADCSPSAKSPAAKRQDGAVERLD